jgi:hypothetical protein
MHEPNDPAGERIAIGTNTRVLFTDTRIIPICITGTREPRRALPMEDQQSATDGGDRDHWADWVFHC